MRRILGLVVIIAALVLVSYYGMGLITERTIRKDVQVINQSQGLHIDIVEYKRSWFNSKAQFNWTLHVPAKEVKDENGQVTTLPAQDYTLNMPLTIYHGPIIFANGVQFGLGYGYTKLNLPPEYMQRFNEMFTPESTIPQLDINVLVNYLNKSRLRIKLPKFTLFAKDEGKSRFEWMGMKNDVTISSNLSTIEGDFDVKGMHFRKDTISANVGKISSEYDLHRSPEGLYVGDASLSFPTFIMSDGDKKVVEVNDYDIETTSDIDDGLLSADFQMSLDRVITPDATYGPGLFRMAVKNLDAKVLAYINEQANKMQQGSDEQKQQAMMVLLPELPKLFSKGARLEISKASFTMPEGTIDGNVYIQLPQGQMSNPFEVMQKIEGAGKVQMPIAVLKKIMFTSEKQQLSQPSLQQAMIDQLQKNQAATNQGNTNSEATQNQAPDAASNSDQAAGSAGTNQAPAPQMTPAEIEQKAQAQSEQKIQGLIQAGFLKVDGSNYVTEFKLANGQLTINGQPYNPATMHF